MKKPLARALTRPLLVRPGARFACASDGLCCTDLHALGPMTRSETRAMRRLIPGSVLYHPDVEAPCMRPGPDGVCEQWKSGLCGVHARHGAEHKPVGCRRFPYGLVSTPLGGRITTEHRCPCRTLGARPALDREDAERSLCDQSGRLEVDEAAPARMPMAKGQRLAFARFAALEAELLARLARGERAEKVLAAEPFPKLAESSWPKVAAELLATDDRSRGGGAMAWVADAVLAQVAGYKPPRRERPWHDAFERGARRAPRLDSPERVFNDWIGDELWMMRFLTWDCAYDVARAELATRLAIARAIARRIQLAGVRADQAAAEAVMAAELCALCEVWGDTVGAIERDPSPAQRL